MEKMNPEVKQMWLEALRSGRYKQDTGYLRIENGYCCLGVLCDLYPKANWEIVEGEYSFFGESQFLTKEVAEWASLKGYTYDEVNNFNMPISEFPLTDMNDIQGKTFEEIADYIEKSL